jgi:pimeloyl-ACP methyl ester carboxylesterase
MNGAVRLLAFALGTVAGLYALACVGMWWVQDTLLFHPPPQTRADLDALAAAEGIEPFTIEAEDGIALYGWHAPGTGEHALLFFHGNGGRLESVQWLAAALEGVDVFSISYRGYPGSEGFPSEAGMARDARALWNHVTQDRGIPPERIVVQGLSMGGGVAHHLLAEAKPAGAVFDSTFLSIEQLAADRFGFLPVSQLLRHPFRSVDRAPGIGVPSLVLHGDADSLIPVAHGRALAKLLPNATYVEIPNQDHNDWSLLDPTARAAWYRFLSRVWNLP